MEVSEFNAMRTRVDAAVTRCEQSVNDADARLTEILRCAEPMLPEPHSAPLSSPLQHPTGH